ncbi:malto-oligosyltrehalose trehalohydrolase [Flavisolibacter ginsenosidimutans]|uniref:Malto-oligosyltrehalose trehalohydrolase n=1 Tax=Flavisolibacter ginsenosidimutans TaxID=661481 RepID=A0A5B8UH25_9BACT|nr:malto-oligosyltrehalose trehalohydrolase [Flavisolibacter ginsenosidimutans]QEC55934.1 malto-oligosyltrehalose trehalohydrolase [Flavisolibacter ginsenosidimutans]
MQPIDVLKRTIGVNFSEEGTVTVKVWSPQAETVQLEVKVKDQVETISLTKERYGYWSATSNKITNGSRYKIKIDDKQSFPDPASLSQPNGVHGDSEAINLAAFQWRETAWNNIPLEDYIIYELHTGTFTPEGTFAAIENRLDYLKELGITAVELMPVAQFPGNRNWGYDGVFPFAVQNSYGGAKDLQRLVDACHQKGLAVVLDVVYNHLGPEGNYLGEFGSYFTSKYNTPWGNAVNFDDAWCDGVRHYFIENALMWLRDFRIDALRLDAVHAIKDFSPVHILKEIKLHVDELMRVTARKHYLIVELDLNDTKFIQPVNQCGYGMNAQWIDEFHHALRVTTGNEKTGYYSDFSGIEHLAKAYKDAYVYDGQWSPHRHKFFGVKADEAEGKQFIVFSQNHDQVGNRMLGERTSELVSFEMQKAMAAAVVLSPYIPLLFMGEEWREPHPFQYFISHTDEALCAAVRKGRKEEFAAFHLEGEAPDPVAVETFDNSKLQWHLIEEDKHKQMLSYYKMLLSLRKSHPVLKNLNRKNLSVNPLVESNALILLRWQESHYVLCLMNFSNEERQIKLMKASEWNIALDSASRQWGGSGESTIEENSVVLRPESTLILTNK